MLVVDLDDLGQKTTNIMQLEELEDFKSKWGPKIQEP